MGRSGYTDDWDGDDGVPPEFYRMAVKAAIIGKRGQAFLRQIAAEMDALPEKRLIEGDLITPEGECCAMGLVCKARNLDPASIDSTDIESVAYLLNIAPAMAREIAYENDQEFSRRAFTETPEQRWIRMRKWVAEQLGETP